jgi:deazaflavin-dependent oxidoreductase (nitroreductase family)
MSRPGDYNAQNIAEFRKNHGKVGGYFAGAPLLLLNTIGRRTGKAHVCPVMYLKDGERFLVFASKGGADTNPDWYFNIKAHPDFQVEIGDNRVDVHAEEVTGREHDALYSRQAALYPRFGDYQQKTKRIIPVIALTRRE